MRLSTLLMVTLLSACAEPGLNAKQRDQVIDIAGDSADTSELESRIDDLESRIDDLEGDR